MKRLYRSKKERMIAGVCGGLSIYFNVDPTLIRLLWALLFFINPAIIIAYLIAAIIIPIEPEGVVYDFVEDTESKEENINECSCTLKNEEITEEITEESEDPLKNI